MAEISARPAGCGYAAQSPFLRGLCCQPDPRLLRHRGSAAPALATTMMSQLAYPCTADGLAVAVVIGRCPCSCWWGERADPAEVLIAARRLAGARPHLAAVAGIVHREDLWQLCRDELTGVDVRIDGWDIRGRWFGVVVGATPRLGELRRGEVIPWRVIAAQLAPRERRGSR